MPTYEYQCDPCGHQFEAYQSITAPPLESCPRCGGQVRRLISAGAGFLFKGSGFYSTDYRSDSYKKAAASEKKADSGDKAATGSKNSGGGESKGSSKTSGDD